VDAARLRQEAESTAREAQSLRADVASHTRKADEVDPDVQKDGSRRSAGTRDDAVRDAATDRDAGTGPGGGVGGARGEGLHADRGRMDDEEARRIDAARQGGTPAETDGRNPIRSDAARAEAAREEAARRDRENPRNGI
jgi:hypothetical protein